MIGCIFCAIVWMKLNRFLSFSYRWWRGRRSSLRKVIGGWYIHQVDSEAKTSNAEYWTMLFVSLDHCVRCIICGDWPVETWRESSRKEDLSRLNRQLWPFLCMWHHAYLPYIFKLIDSSSSLNLDRVSVWISHRSYIDFYYFIYPFSP